MNVHGNNILEDDVPFCDPLLGDGEVVGWIILELDVLFWLLLTIELLDIGKRDRNPVPYKAAEIQKYVF